jgi:hypothetical protein
MDSAKQKTDRVSLTRRQLLVASAAGAVLALPTVAPAASVRPPAELGPHRWILSGQIRNATDAEPIAGAIIHAWLVPDQPTQTQSDADGRFVLVVVATQVGALRQTLSYRASFGSLAPIAGSVAAQAQAATSTATQLLDENGACRCAVAIALTA